MATSSNQPVPTLSDLPVTLPRKGAIEIELEQGVLIFRVSEIVQNRIETLLDKHRASSLTPDEEQELRRYEDLDDYMSYLNRLTRNQAEGIRVAEKFNVVGAQIRAAFASQYASLTSTDRAIVSLYTEGMTFKQIAERLSIPLPTVLHRLKSFERNVLKLLADAFMESMPADQRNLVKLLADVFPKLVPADTTSESPLREDEAPR